MAGRRAAVRVLASLVSGLQAKKESASAAKTTFQSSLAGALHELDSDQSDPVTTLDSPGTIEFDQTKSSSKKGKLQKVRETQARLFGVDGAPGLFGQIAQCEDQEDAISR